MWASSEAKGDKGTGGVYPWPLVDQAVPMRVRPRERPVEPVTVIRTSGPYHGDDVLVPRDAGEQIGQDGLAWPQTTDVEVWVARWRQALAEQPGVAQDGRALQQWFAEAMKAGYDMAVRAQQEKRP